MGDAKFCEATISVWESFVGRRAKFKGLCVIPHAIFWLLWMEINRGVFDGVETSLEWLKDKWLKTLFFGEEEVFCSSLLKTIDFVDSLYLGCNSLLWVAILAPF